MTLKRETSYPREVSLNGLEVVLRHMSSKDAEALMRFADGLSEHDLLFLRRDIRKLEAIEDVQKCYNNADFSDEAIDSFQ